MFLCKKANLLVIHGWQGKLAKEGGSSPALGDLLFPKDTF